MKNKLLKIFTATAVFALGIGTAININKQPTELIAAQHSTNYASYTYSGSYYSKIDTSKSGGMQGDFRKSLTSLIFPKGWYVYSGGGSDHLSTVLQYADADPTNNSNMVYLYTRDSVKKNAASSWNREHVWPQSLSADNWGTGQAGTDILHLRPTYSDTNSKRGNKIYGNVTHNSTNALTYDGMSYGWSAGNNFEPLDSVKGDVARIIMYVWTTYYDYYHDQNGRTWWPTNTIANYDTLLEWHTMDKPDAMEGNRNDYSETSKQKNRNPFVDHPEYAWKVFGDNASASVKSACMEAYPMDGGDTPVVTKQLSKISISGQATKTNYYVGETFNPAGLTVTATYTDNSTSTINNSNCTWTPSPLTEGTTSVTCTYEGKTATYNGITVTKREVSGDGYVVEFKNNEADGSGALSAASIYSGQLSNNNLITSVVNANKVYAGKNGLKLGSGSGAGEIQLALANDAKTDISHIEIVTETYNTDSATYKIKLNDTVEADGIATGTKFSKDIDHKSATTITISGISGRFYLSKITIMIGQSGGDTPSGSSSSAPSSSSVPSSSSTPSSSSVAPSSSETPTSSTEVPSSSSSEMPSSESSSSQEPSSQAQSSNIPSSQPVSSSEEPVIIDEPTGENGCGGSIVGALSLTSVGTLIGLVFVLSKKKKY